MERGSQVRILPLLYRIKKASFIEDFYVDLTMKFDLKNILIGVIIGVVSTTSIFLLIGDVDIQTDFQFGEKSDTDNKDIRLLF